MLPIAQTTLIIVLILLPLVVVAPKITTNTRLQSYISSPSVTTNPSPTPPATLPLTTQHWLIAAGGIIAVQNREGLDTLQVTTSSPQVRQLLSDWWDITDRASALNILQWLKTYGHRQEYEDFRLSVLNQTGDDYQAFLKLKPTLLQRVSPNDRTNMSFELDFLWRYRNTLNAQNLLAWDYMRLINVARWSYTVGYITEAEAWNYLLFAGQTLQSTYTSWADMGQHYLYGRTYWQHSYNNTQAQTALQWLTSNPQSPWLTLPWDTPIN